MIAQVEHRHDVATQLQVHRCLFVRDLWAAAAQQTSVTIQALEADTLEVVDFWFSLTRNPFVGGRPDRPLEPDTEQTRTLSFLRVRVTGILVGSEPEVQPTPSNESRSQRCGLGKMYYIDDSTGIVGFRFPPPSTSVQQYYVARLEAQLDQSLGSTVEVLGKVAELPEPGSGSGPTRYIDCLGCDIKTDVMHDLYWTLNVIKMYRNQYFPDEFRRIDPSDNAMATPPPQSIDSTHMSYHVTPLSNRQPSFRAISQVTPHCLIRPGVSKENSTSTNSHPLSKSPTAPPPDQSTGIIDLVKSNEMEDDPFDDLDVDDLDSIERMANMTQAATVGDKLTSSDVESFIRAKGAGADMGQIRNAFPQANPQDLQNLVTDLLELGVIYEPMANDKPPVRFKVCPVTINSTNSLDADTKPYHNVAYLHPLLWKQWGLTELHPWGQVFYVCDSPSLHWRTAYCRLTPEPQSSSAITHLRLGVALSRAATPIELRGLPAPSDNFTAYLECLTSQQCSPVVQVKVEIKPPTTRSGLKVLAKWGGVQDNTLPQLEFTVLKSILRGILVDSTGVETWHKGEAVDEMLCLTSGQVGYV
ncbi:hypothetical protein IWQ62_001720 [Dispira parvispora]|uniref:Uncharacterized protein n=1 Tax=Dispira parvispora TaxID=1520584 RepID=A0A9W8ARR9_9FUNG|nr:hypothetical protein IWQ62_001720 [Dispira parvispora]